MPDLDTFRKDFIVKSFNRDAVIAGSLGAAFNVTSESAQFRRTWIAAGHASARVLVARRPTPEPRASPSGIAPWSQRG